MNGRSLAALLQEPDIDVEHAKAASFAATTKREAAYAVERLQHHVGR